MKKLESAIIEALSQCTTDNVDITLNEENNSIDIVMYNPDKNALCFKENVCEVGDNLNEVIELANRYGIGYAL